jgi:hypothetical protein
VKRRTVLAAHAESLLYLEEDLLAEARAAGVPTSWLRDRS